MGNKLNITEIIWLQSAKWVQKRLIKNSSNTGARKIKSLHILLSDSCGSDVYVFFLCLFCSASGRCCDCLHWSNRDLWGNQDRAAMQSWIWKSCFLQLVSQWALRLSVSCPVDWRQPDNNHQVCDGIKHGLKEQEKDFLKEILFFSLRLEH